VLHDGMPYDAIKGQGHGGTKVAKKWPISKSIEVYLLRQYACNQKTNGEL